MKKTQQSDSITWPFNQTAHDYDNEFTNSALGRIYRNRVWARMDAVFTGKRNILELGCGTGEDALYLAKQGHQITALDASEDMVEQTRVKIENEGLSEHVTVKVMNIQNLNQLVTSQVTRDEKIQIYDGVLANFGVLNCVSDLPSLALSLHKILLPGSPGIFTIMGPLVPWEWAWYLLKGKPDKAFRRFRKDGVTWRGITIWYPSIQKAQAAFSPFFITNNTIALGTFLPPSYAESWAQAHPNWIKRLGKIEERFVSSPIITRLADHYLLEMKRTT